MYLCGVQIAHRKFQKVYFRIHKLKPPTELIMLTVVERSEHALGSRGYCE